MWIVRRIWHRPASVGEGGQSGQPAGAHAGAPARIDERTVRWTIPPPSSPLTQGRDHQAPPPPDRPLSLYKVQGPGVGDAKDKERREKETERERDRPGADAPAKNLMPPGGHPSEAWHSPDDRMFEPWAASFIQDMGVTPSAEIVARLKSAAVAINALRAARKAAEIDLDHAGTILQACRAAASAPQSLAETDLLANLVEAVAAAVRKAVARLEEDAPHLAAAADDMLSFYEAVDDAARVSVWRRRARWILAEGDADAAVGHLVEAVKAAGSRAEVDVGLVERVYRSCAVAANAALAEEDYDNVHLWLANMLRLVKVLADFARQHKDLELARTVSGLTIEAALIDGLVTLWSDIPKWSQVVLALAQGLGDPALATEAKLARAAGSYLPDPDAIVAATGEAERLGDAALSARTEQVTVALVLRWLSALYRRPNTLSSITKVMDLPGVGDVVRDRTPPPIVDEAVYSWLTHNLRPDVVVPRRDLLSVWVKDVLSIIDRFGPEALGTKSLPLAGQLVEGILQDWVEHKPEEAEWRLVEAIGVVMAGRIEIADRIRAAAVGVIDHRLRQASDGAERGDSTNAEIWLDQVERLARALRTNDPTLASRAGAIRAKLAPHSGSGPASSRGS